MKTIYKKLLFLFLLLPFSVLAQSTLTGTVADVATGQPIPGVNVNVQGAPGGSSTDFDGKFQLSNLKNGDKILVSFIGYKTSTVVFNGQKTISISLEEDTNQLKEVVVQVGYGTVKKKDATGAVTVLSANQLNKGPVGSADQLLVGRASGVRITTDGGMPDANPNIRIRGGSSLSGNNNPLIIIDGVPIDNTNPAGISNPLTLINPNDIDSFTILKDASATAIYGSRASNGVIIVTTKRGVSGAPKFTFSSNVTIGKVNNPVDMMTGPEFTSFIQKYHPTYTNLLGIPDGSGAVDNPATPQIEGRTLYNTDWQDLIYRTSISTDNNFSARANLFGKIPFRASVGYAKNEGVVRTNDLERYTGSLRLSPVLLDNHLKIDVNAKGISVKKNAIDGDAVIGSALGMDPTKPAYADPNSPNNIFGGYYQLLNTNNSINGAQNPLAILNQRSRPEEVQKLVGNIELDYKMPFLESLRAVVNGGVEASKSKIRETYTDNAIQTYQIDNSAATTPPTYVFNPGLNYAEDQTVTNKTLDAYFVYNKSLTGFVTRVDAQAGYSYQNFKTDGNKGIYRYSTENGLREPTPNPSNANNRYYNERNLQSFFGRANFDLVDKYLFTFTLRADGSSLFKEDKRWGYFPAAGVAWRMKDESFLKDSKTFKDLKLRLGYGITGQQDITGVAGSYPYSALFAPTSSSSTYIPGVNGYYAKPYNEDLTWEKTTTYNVGIDFDLFEKSIVTGSIDAYQKYTKDLLSVVSAAPGQALTNEFVSNVGSMKNKGIEGNLNVKVINSDDFNLSLNGNIAYNIGEITDLNNRTTNVDNASGIPVGTGQKIAYNTVGQQPYSAWVFQQVYDSNNRPVENAFVDKNGDGVINDSDRYYVALRPNWTYGLGLTASYKQFDLSTTFNGQIGGKVYNARKLQSGFIDKALPANSTSLTNVLNTEFDFQTINGNVPFSDYYLEDASFLRCQNITLGYNFDKAIKGAVLRLYASANNVFIVTDYTGVDPENFNAIDNNFYPRSRTFSFGLNLDF
ncbi:SusC/RagA family TonB-linked outer membrane protein [Flavobacterium piscis]|uniref:SusC/RagA family TonB-linked outer membrane protein n=1 Tax=Flavobacterium piscis TaxID=1114874 RepID=A0ABX2XPT7_9FLAO|nr:SusC/RagA family TonB-linked outer membrane protein [Flavobacterium piscis]OCB75599.1 SusC/RagA family TonB-linked outer membrane protein [Flavobacterium piscis]OXE99660.1 SusC/RagA family TonB-linked outer membrane protein [Flavobacterium piscis]